jgi:hypothetical protein
MSIMSPLEQLWRGASRSQRYRTAFAGAMVVWAGLLVADMHYLRARPEFKQKFPGAATAGESEPQQHEQEEAAEPEWRAARRAREASEAAAAAAAAAGGSSHSVEASSTRPSGGRPAGATG